MRVEKRQELGRPCGFPGLRRDSKRQIAWHTASEPTHGETQTQVGRSLNELDAGSMTATGRRVRPKEEPPKIRRESDPLTVLGDGRADHRGKGRTEVRSW